MFVLKLCWRSGFNLLNQTVEGGYETRHKFFTSIEVFSIYMRNHIYDKGKHRLETWESC